MKLKGYFHVEVIDIHTGEVVREFDSDNNVVYWGFDRLGLMRNWGVDFGGYSPWDRQWTIWLSPDVWNDRVRKMTVRTNSEFNPGDPADSTDFVTSAIGNPLRQEYIPPSGPVPAAYQVFGQFNPPPIGTTRTINTIACGGGFNEIHAFTDIRLAPCIQTDSQQLNVTYRTQFFDDPVPSVTDVWRNPNATEWWAQAHAYTMSDGSPLPSEIDTPDRAMPFYFKKTFLPHITDDSKYEDIARMNSSDGHAQGYNGDNTPSQYAAFPGISGNVRDQRTIGNTFKPTWDFDWTVSEGIGRIYGTTILGQINHEILETRFAPTTFPNQPIQVIHNHSRLAPQPFLDTNFLATGQGTISMDGSAWASTSRHPKMLRIDINNTGDVGVSRYTYRWKHMTGGMQAEDSTAPGNQKWRGVWEPWKYASEFNETFWPDVLWNWATTPGGNNKDFATNTNCFEEWSDPEYVVLFTQEPTTQSSKVGVALVNIYTGACVYFDDTTTPALATTKIHQVAVSDNGTIWAADADTGLYRITDPLGSPTITKMTVATHGIPAGTEQCYAVHQGFGDSIWAMFDGGLSKSTDGGVSWTNHDPGSGPAFDYSLNGGITNGNWANVRMLVVDRETPDNEMCIQYVGPTLTTRRAAHAWWSEAGVSYQGPDGNSIRNHDTRTMLKTDGGLPRHQLKVSRRGGFFVGCAHPSAGSNGAYRYDFGHTQPYWLDKIYTNANGNNDGRASTEGRPIFHYDQYGVPFTYSGTNGGGYSSSRNGLFSQYNNIIGNVCSSASLHPCYSIEQFGTPTNPEYYSGFWIGNDPSIKQGGGDIFCWSDVWSTDVGGPLGQWEFFEQDNYIQDIIWYDMRWNGASWVANYHADAVDSTANSYDGTRQGFQVEDLEFYGRSSIQVPTAAGTNFGGGDLTFVATVSPVAYWDGSDENAQQKTLFSWSNGLPGSAGNEFNFYWDRFFKTDAVNPVSPTPELGAHVYTKGPAGAPGNHLSSTGGFATTPLDGGTFRVVFTLSGTQLRIFVDGVEQGSVGGQAVPGMSTTALNMQDIFIGCRAALPSMFFRGQMENIQIWNYPWTPADAVIDSGNPTGVNIPAGGAIGNLIVHYQNNVSIAGQESKATHVGQEALHEGITIGFADGTSSPAFVDTDWYNTGVCDGIFKDNATSFDYHHELYVLPVTYDFGDIEDTVNSPAASQTSATVPGAGGVVTEIPAWRNTDQITNTDARIMNDQVHGVNGIEDMNTFQVIPGDGYFEWRMPTTYPADQMAVGVTEVPNDDSSNPGFTYEVRFRNSGVGGSTDRAYEIRTDNSLNVAAAGPGQFAPDDVFRITKSGATVQLHVNGGLIHTWARASASPLFGRIRMNGLTGSVMDLRINYVRPAGYLDLGNSLAVPTPTGKYHPEHLTFDDIGINGTVNAVAYSAIKVDTTFRMDEITTSPSAPGVGEVTFIPDAGLALFNPANYGQTATLTAIQVRYE